MRQSIPVARIDDSRLTKARSWGKIIVAKQMIFAPAPPDMCPPFVAGFVFLVSRPPLSNRWRKSSAPTWYWSRIGEARQSYGCGNPGLRTRVNALSGLRVS